MGATSPLREGGLAPASLSRMATAPRSTTSHIGEANEPRVDASYEGVASTTGGRRCPATLPRPLPAARVSLRVSSRGGGSAAATWLCGTSSRGPGAAGATTVVPLPDGKHCNSGSFASGLRASGRECVGRAGWFRSLIRQIRLGDIIEIYSVDSPLRCDETRESHE